MPATAKIADTLIASTDTYEFVEGNVYFPLSSIVDAEKILRPTERHTHCPWKGDASYYTVTVDGQELENAAWYYPKPFEKAKHIEGHIAFYKNKVTVERE